MEKGQLKMLLGKELDRLNLLLEEMEQNSVQLESFHSDHPAEAATDLTEAEICSGEMNDIRQRISEVRHALHKIEHLPQKAGLCEQCGRPVGEGRLKAKPWARYCLLCREALEKKGIRHS
ncbi:MAG: TraR/DksA C4-type zinc finger protein [Synergistota bacterium]|nr:TraR/DksA C4-type zinc finger protein [Synergistota bacterium]